MVMALRRKIAVPIGISFYTLQAIGYMADVYWGKIPAERHLGKVALFLGFFPQIMEGPIAMYSQTADALWSGESLKLKIHAGIYPYPSGTSFLKDDHCRSPLLSGNRGL